MTDKYPNIKRPIETAPRDGTKILIWYGYTNPVTVHWERGAFRDRTGEPTFGQVYWSPMPHEPEHCCGQFHALVDIKTIVTDQDHWFLKFNAERSAPCITFCPFCGEKLK